MDQQVHSQGRGRGRPHHQSQHYRSDNGQQKDQSYNNRRNNDYSSENLKFEQSGGNSKNYNYSSSQSDVNKNNGNRRNRKPEQQFYVPKQQQQHQHQQHQHQQQPQEQSEQSNKSFPFDENLASGDNNSRQCDDRSYSSTNYNKDDKIMSKTAGKMNYKNHRHNYNNNNRNNKTDNSDLRQIRQASEPRLPMSQSSQNSFYGSSGGVGGGDVGHNGNDRHQRDTRSVEPNIIIREKKPPTGRRNSNCSEKGAGIRLPPNIESLPPRFQKKILQESGLPLSILNQPQQSTSATLGGAAYENNWDGRSITFSGHHSHNNNQRSYSPSPNWSQTLPTKGRGRGRMTDFVPLEYTRSRSRSSDIAYQDDYDYKNYDSYDNFRSSNRSLNYDHDNYNDYNHHRRNNANNSPSNFRRRQHFYDNENRNSNQQKFMNEQQQQQHHQQQQSQSQPQQQHQSKRGNINRRFNNFRYSTNTEGYSSSEHLNHFDEGFNKNSNHKNKYQYDQYPKENYDRYNKRPQTPQGNDDHYSRNSDRNQPRKYNDSEAEHQQRPPSSDTPKTPTMVIEQFDWSEDVENSLKESEKVNTTQDETTDRYQRRRRKRGGGRKKNLKVRINSGQHHNNGNSKENTNQQNNPYSNTRNYENTFKVPYPPKNSYERNRQNSQSSNLSESRDNSVDRMYRNRRYNRSRKNSYEYESVSREGSLDRNQQQYHPGRNSRNKNRNRNQWSSRENSTDSQHHVRNSNESLNNLRDPDNWRKQINFDEEIKTISNKIDTLNKTKDYPNDKEFIKTPGVLVLPSTSMTSSTASVSNSRNAKQQRDQSFETASNQTVQQKTLFDPNNPNQPIVVTQSQSTRKYINQNQDLNNLPDSTTNSSISISSTFQENNKCSNTYWYNPNSDSYRLVHKSYLIDKLAQADYQIQDLLANGLLFREWDKFMQIRICLQELLEQFLVSEMKFCHHENVEHHMWKLLYYNVIELLRKSHAEDNDVDNKLFYKNKLMEIIEDGTVYFEKLLRVLETSYKFDLDDFIGVNAAVTTNGLKYVGLSLVSAQKLYLFLGDLARYKEQINETTNYGRAKQFYIKAQQILPRNGRPYNQLAVLSVYSKRKVDAVYFYMRSLMSSNPFQSARESLLGLFDETRKKYENSQKKREEKNRLRLKEKEHRFGGPLRRETWIHPEGGRRIHRTSPLDPLANRNGDTSEEEELENLDSVELNKRFITSYLHVHGKLITKIGMESFTQCAIQMLREFRALLRLSPIAIASHRLLQLTALNMFAIDYTQLKDPSIAPGGRSEVQECAISIALLMFGIILERFVTIIKETLSPGSTKPILTPIIMLGGENILINDTINKNNKLSSSSSATATITTSNDTKIKQQTKHHLNDKQEKLTTINDEKKSLILTEDARVLLPSIKVWCDWLLCHNNVWNPPPTCSDYKLGSYNNGHDPWSKLASMIMILENVDTNRHILSTEKKEDYELVRLQEDIALAGFTPLMYNRPEPIFCHRNADIELAQNALRLQKVIFVATKFLCSCDPPVLEKVTYEDGTWEYISVVQNRTDESSDSEMLVETFSDEDESDLNSINNKSLTVAATVASNNVNKTDSESNTVAAAIIVTTPIDDGKNSINNKLLNTSISSSSSSSSSAAAAAANSESAVEIRKLLRRKDELERRHKMQEKHSQRIQDILRQSTVSVNIEVRPKILIPDTNCFIDFLDQLKIIAEAHPLYQLMVPLVVLNELEGLSRGCKNVIKSNPLSVSSPLAPTLTIFPLSSSAATVAAVTSGNILGPSKITTVDPKHAAMVAESSKNALSFLKSKNPAVKCVTTKGSILNSSIFTIEDDNDSEQISNDDKILITAVNLCKNNLDGDRDGTRYIVREVVLLTTDRNLRVKSLSRDVPVRELPDFIKWAGLGP